jgi:hypothetical protein
MVGDSVRSVMKLFMFFCCVKFLFFLKIPSMHAYISCRVYRRLANEKFYLPVVHGTR